MTLRQLQSHINFKLARDPEYADVEFKIVRRWTTPTGKFRSKRYPIDMALSCGWLQPEGKEREYHAELGIREEEKD